MNNITKTEKQPHLPSIKDELRDLIIRSLNTHYISESCQDNIQTGNHYQSITLGEVQTSGFRKSRSDFLDLIDFNGKKVLDLGSNLGEVSRAARAKGACLVDGFEYDRFFLEIANAINAYNETTRVSFHHRDITDPLIYNECYDIVLAFSVFIYIHPIIERISQITGQLLAIETHKLEENLESTYLKTILPYFPCYKILGESEWGTPHAASEKRAVIVFSKQEELLTTFKTPVNTTVTSISPDSVTPTQHYSADERLAGAFNTPVGAPVTADPLTLAKNHGATKDQYIDTSKTPWYDRFFSTLEFSSVENLLAAINDIRFNIDTIAKSLDLTKNGLEGWVYWLLYLKGYLQYLDNDAVVGKGNVYYDYLTKYSGARAHDPGLLEILTDPKATLERVILRFHDFDILYRRGVGISDEIDPIDIFVSATPSDDTKMIYEMGNDTPIYASIIDGYHRLFLARLFGIMSLQYTIMQEDQALSGIIFRIQEIVRFTLPYNANVAVVSKGNNELLNLNGQPAEHFPQTESGAHLDSYPADSAAAITQLETLREKGIQFLLFPKTELWWLSRYGEFKQYLESRYRVVAQHDDTCLIFTLHDLENVQFRSQGAPDGLQLPTPEMICLVAGVYDAQRFYESGFLGAESIRSVLRKNNLDINSFESILDFGCGCGRIIRHWKDLQGPQLFGTDYNPYLIGWCQQFLPFAEFNINRLVSKLNYEDDTFSFVYVISIFTHLNEELQNFWLNELARILRPGGFLFLTVHGTTRLHQLSPKQREEYESGHVVVWKPEGSGTNACATYHPEQYIRQVWAKTLNIIDFVPGGDKGANQDAVLLQKPFTAAQ